MAERQLSFGFYSEAEREIAVELIRRLQDRERLSDIARSMCIPYPKAARIARESGVPYGGRVISAAENGEILRLRFNDGQSIRHIARTVGISRSYVGRVTKAEIERYADLGGIAVRPLRLAHPRRCPVHGLVRLWPCVACAATELRE